MAYERAGKNNLCGVNSQIISEKKDGKKKITAMAKFSDPQVIKKRRVRAEERTNHGKIQKRQN